MLALLDGTISAEQFEPEKLHDPFILSLLERTEVHEDPELTSKSPEHVPNRVQVTLDDGQVLTIEVDDPPGHDKNPLTLEQLRTKYNGLVVPAIGTGRATRLWDFLQGIVDEAEPSRAFGLLSE